MLSPPAPVNPPALSCVFARALVSHPVPTVPDAADLDLDLDLEALAAELDGDEPEADLEAMAAELDDDEEEPTMSFWTALGGLIFVTGLVSLYSDWLVSSIDGFTESSGISKTFVGLIILPVVGNAVEHITAVTVAMKNKMDLSMGVAVGSSAQVSLFVVPFIILYGWAKDINMTLNFPPFEIMLYILAVVIVTNCVSNGKSNWLEGR